MPRRLAVSFSHKIQDAESGFLNQSDNPVEWNSLTGVDMIAAFRFRTTDKDQVATVTFAELQTLSISSTRSIFPVRCLGESVVRAYTRGARTFAGSLIFTMFDRDPLMELAKRDDLQESQNPDEPFFMDQLPEFDIVINGVNEYGAMSTAIVGGVTITNYGTTLSIHDIYTEISYTYVARFYIPFSPDRRAVDAARDLMQTQRKMASQVSNAIMMNGLFSKMRPEDKGILDKFPVGTTVGNMIRDQI